MELDEALLLFGEECQGLMDDPLLFAAAGGGAARCAMAATSAPRHAPAADAASDCLDPAVWLRAEAASPPWRPGAMYGGGAPEACPARVEEQAAEAVTPLPASKPAPPAPAPLDLAGWRCLSSKHGADCERCLPPPPPDAVADWVLIGDKRTRNGEKKLRTLLTQTPEWASLQARAEAATKVGDEGLATALRGRDVSALRKAHFFLLCACWKYRSNTWVRRAPVLRAGARAATAADVVPAAPAAAPACKRARSPPTAQQPAWLALPLLAPSPGTASLRAALQHRLLAYAAATNDARAHAAVRAEPGAPLMTWSVPGLEAILPTARALSAHVAADAAAMALALAAQSAPGSCSCGGGCGGRACAPWWLSEERERLLRADGHLMLVASLLAAWGQGQARLRVSATWAALSGPDRACSEVWGDAIAALDNFVSLAQAALAGARVRRCGDEVVAVAAEVLAALGAVTRHFVAVNESRRAWLLCLGAPAAARDAQRATQGPFWRDCLELQLRMGVPSATSVAPGLGQLLAAGVGKLQSNSAF